MNRTGLVSLAGLLVMTYVPGGIAEEGECNPRAVTAALQRHDVGAAQEALNDCKGGGVTIVDLGEGSSCAVIVDGVAVTALQCAEASISASQSPATCGYPNCYTFYGNGGGGALLLGGSANAQVYDGMVDCTWTASAGWNSCETPYHDGVVQVPPGTLACAWTHTVSVAWYVWEASAVANCN